MPRPPGKVENPALQKAETEWKAANASSSSQSMPKLPCTSASNKAVPAISMANVKPNIYRSVVSNESSDSELTMSRTANWL